MASPRSRRANGRKSRAPSAEPLNLTRDDAGVDAFTFGDPVEIEGGRRALLDSVGCVDNGRWYEPPVSMEALARAYDSSPHHPSAMQLKRNRLVAAFQPTKWLTRSAFEAFAQDFIVMGNGFLEGRYNELGSLISLQHALALNTRRGIVDGEFWNLLPHGGAEAFDPDTVVQIRQPALRQEIYGIPEYISAINSALLNESATLFRMKYYHNGSHAGYILHSKGDINAADIAALKDALKKSKGPGNFRSMFVHTPNGKDGDIKVIPIAQLGANDEFLGIKNVSRDDVLAAHRVPPQLLGIVPAQGSSGFGNPLQAADMFDELEIVPIQMKLLAVNEAVGVEAIRFAPRQKLASDAKA